MTENSEIRILIAELEHFAGEAVQLPRKGRRVDTEDRCGNAPRVTRVARQEIRAEQARPLGESQELRR